MGARSGEQLRQGRRGCPTTSRRSAVLRCFKGWGWDG
jgi:hypothetical protein